MKLKLKPIPVGVLLLIVAVLSFFSTEDNLYTQGVQTAGIVKTSSKGLMSKSYHDVTVEYRDAQQQVHELSARVHTLRQFFGNYRAGKKVVVAYDKNNPSRAILLAWEMKYIGGFPGIVGIVLIGIGWFLGKRNSRE
jgi:hypothetical protein